MKAHHVILGIHVTDRLQEATELQAVLTAFGAHVKTRLGLHETNGEQNSPEGIVLLELVGTPERLADLKAHLQAIHGLEVQEMIFTH